MTDISIRDYDKTNSGFINYLEDVADELFPFPSYYDYQDELLYEILEAMFVDDYDNIIVEGPTGIGKSPVNVTVARVVSYLNDRKRTVRDYFDVTLDIDSGNSFYTTPQKSLRNQLAEDHDLRDYVAMLKARADYTCGVTGSQCSDCKVRTTDGTSCMTEPGCTYWQAKEDAMDHDIAVLTFAMLVIDNYIPVEMPDGGPGLSLMSGEGDTVGNQISFDDRDLVIVDEAHNCEGQSSSLFAGFTLSPWTLPGEVFDKAGRRASWDDDRFEDVEDIVEDIARRCEKFINVNEDNPMRASEVEKCENMKRKIKYCFESYGEGKGWVVNINEVSVPGSSDDTTKAIEIKPVRVQKFLQEHVWSRATKSLITSATIPFRGNVSKWADRIGLPGDTKFISKPSPFAEDHRLIHLNTTVGKMSGEGEEKNWYDAMHQIQIIQSYHRNENGLIHSVSYSRAERVGRYFNTRDELPDVIVDEQELELDAMIDRWQNAYEDIIVSPRMIEGVDLHGDKCRWQVLFKVPYAHIGDSRVSYLLNEKYEWQWYKEEAAMKVIQMIGRAVRGPEPDEAASFYVIDDKFDKLMYATTPPEYIGSAVRDKQPLHWEFPKAAPWRTS